MRAKLPLRIAAVILFLFALGHTVGFLSFRPPEPEAAAVLDAMSRVPFDFGGHMVHWMDFYKGFGLAISISGFVTTIIAWRLSMATDAEAALAQTIAWLLCAIQVGSIVLSLLYFGPVQSIFSALAAAVLAWGAVKLKP